MARPPKLTPRIAARIQHLVALGWTHGEVARELGLSRSCVGNAARGKLPGGVRVQKDRGVRTSSQTPVRHDWTPWQALGPEVLADLDAVWVFDDPEQHALLERARFSRQHPDMPTDGAVVEALLDIGAGDVIPLLSSAAALADISMLFVAPSEEEHAVALLLRAIEIVRGS